MELARCEHDGVSDVYLATKGGHGDELVLEGNRCGLLHLAAQLLALADQAGNHIHLDEASGLEECSEPIVVSHVENPW